MTLRSGSAMGVIKKILVRLRELSANQVELMERQELLRRPWAEEFLHWTPEGELHGTRLPPNGRRRSTTSSGWCPGRRV